ncbi:MAG: site-2 protease family protein [Spirochaetes bacterium]|nr:site-2 protease family protein [Spirochaetota bacterium]
MDYTNDNFIRVIIAASWIIPLLFSVIPHEVAHGYIALRLGDNTAKEMGRLSLNPLRHIDFYGTIVIPAFLILSNTGFVFGYARPVPVNFANFKNYRKGMILVSLAGPLTNFILAAIFLAIIIMLKSMSIPKNIISVFLYTSFVNTALLNTVLGIFNLIPLPPLDGGKIAIGLLPQKAAAKYAKLDSKAGFIILIILLILPRIFGDEYNLIGRFISFFTDSLFNFVF